MRLLITGGLGFIGSNFIIHVIKNFKDFEIINLDAETHGSNHDNLKDIDDSDKYTFVKGNITNKKLVEDLISQSDCVVNFAAESHVDRSIANPKPFIETNVLGTYTILEGIRKHDKQFIHVSTDELYGDAGNQDSFNEKSILKPSNPYSATKAAADHLVGSYARTYGIKCIITRCTNNFGPFQFPEKLIPKTIIRAQKNLKVPLYGSGDQIRSWIYVLDHVSAIESLISKGLDGEIYNITSWNEISNKTIVEKILNMMEKPNSLIEYVGDRPGHDKRYSIDSSKIQNEIGWKPKYDFEQALRETVEWYLQNQDWWEPLVDEKVLHPQPWTLSW